MGERIGSKRIGRPGRVSERCVTLGLLMSAYGRIQIELR
jgi:hypothetical protein